MSRDAVPRSRLGIGHPITDLTIPEKGSTTAREVLSASLKKLVRDLAEVPVRAPSSARVEASVLRATVETAVKANPGALMAALRRPTISALIRCLRPLVGLSELRRDALIVELLAALRYDLSGAGVPLPAATDCRNPDRIVSLFDRSVRLASGETSSPFFDVSKNVVLAVVDNNPLAMEEAHPDKEGNAIDLGGRDPGVWCDMLRDAFDLVREHLPDLAGEIDLFVHQIVPVGFHEQRHLSASYQEAIGTIYMTLHPSLMTMTEALIHEFSHNKINALFELDEVLENAWSPLYTSPVRPDPRPLHGVLLAVHAFLPVARLYEVMTEAKHPRALTEDFQKRFAQIRKTNREGCEVVLGNGKPTEVGKPLLAEIARWDAHYSKMEMGGSA
ncbi:MAG: hypothetical protein IPK82_05110 [Polyangiaceae bacterium]|nr:hypothetical protein [Polyangiaceae bacterium]